MGQKYFLIGGLGFVGGHLIEALLKDPETELIQIIDLARLTGHTSIQFNDPRVHVYLGDAATPGELEIQLLRQEFDFTFQLAVTPLVYSLVEPRDAFEKIIGPQRALLESARKGYVKKNDLVFYKRSLWRRPYGFPNSRRTDFCAAHRLRRRKSSV